MVLKICRDKLFVKMKIDRVGAIKEMFTMSYFSFLPTSHSVWKQTSDMISLYWDLGQDISIMEQLQQTLLEAVINHQVKNQLSTKKLRNK